MSYADMLVTVDNSDQAEQTLLMVVEMSRVFDAHLSAIYPIQSLAMLPYAGMAAGSVIIHNHEKAQKEQAETSGDKYRKLADKKLVKLEWLDPIGDPTELVCEASRLVDLTILMQGNPEHTQSTIRGLSNKVLIDTGRPTLVAPYIACPALPFRRVLVAWDNSKSAARAINDALPFLRAADSVEVTTVYEAHKHEATGANKNENICQHLLRQGVGVTSTSLPHSDIDIGNTLLNHISDTGADLLVMGAYGHSRLHEIVFGGATRTVLGSMTIPVLLSH